MESIYRLIKDLITLFKRPQIFQNLWPFFCSKHWYKIMNTNNNTFSVIFAYLMMIIIWSTTPLTIKWSTQGVDFITGLSARMIIGSLLALGLCLLWHKRLPLDRKALRVYFASSFSIFGSMMLVYFGAQFISSGLISVIFGLAPIFTSWFAIHLFATEKFSMGKFIGAVFGISGLAYIFLEQFNMGEHAPLGITTVLIAVTIHSISAIWVKQINVKLPALTVTAGGLAFSLPLFIFTFVIFGDPIPLEIPSRTLWSIIYLGTMGSVIGFMSYYYVLANLSASTVALATLVTPVTALLLGNSFNQEEITTHIWIGTALILFGLIIHQFKGIASIQLLKRSKETGI